MYCYIHIPFCQSKCKYCRFSSFAFKDELEKQFYVNYLVKEIEKYTLKDCHCEWNGAIHETWIILETGLLHTPVPGVVSQWQEKLDTIYFWWWTPTSLKNTELEEIIMTIKNKFGFKQEIEITLETTNSNITKENLIEWQKIWINRLSLWIQTLNDESLKEIWRTSREEILEKLDIINDYFKIHSTALSFIPPPQLRGIKGELNLTISLDFIIWLPYVKKGEIQKDLKYVLKNYSFVNHISLYMLEEYYDYPKKWQEISIKDDEYLEEYLTCKKQLENNWYNRYELSNFAKPWFECKHNKAYWNNSDVIAFWLWSHGFLDWSRYAYPNNFKDYYSWTLDYKEKLSKNDIFLENIMFWLRTSWIEKTIYELLNKEKIKYFIEQKLLDFQDNKLILSDNWVTLIDYIIKEIV